MEVEVLSGMLEREVVVMVSTSDGTAGGIAVTRLSHGHACTTLQKVDHHMYMHVYVAVTGRKRTVGGLIRLAVSLECFIEITPDFLCPFMND